MRASSSRGVSTPTFSAATGIWSYPAVELLLATSGLTLSARLRGEEWAKRTQLTLEYDPQPPFVGGTPEKAGAEATQDILRRRAPALAAARSAAERAGARLRG